MKIAVIGLWHLGLVTAACLATSGHEVVALADDAAALEALLSGQLPIFEPGLDEMIAEARRAGTLRFSVDPQVLGRAELVWITHDTPVDDDDRADVAFVSERVIALFPALGPATLVLVSSQLPVGSTAALEQAYRRAAPHGTATFAYSPENLRLGQAIDAFTRPERVVVGLRDAHDRGRLETVFRPYTENILWMAVESAEMTKHALNAWLAMSVAFINEIATLCERTGADVGDVSKGLKSDIRVGQRAYLRPGSAFAGGTLARDIVFLSEVATQHGLSLEVAPAIRRSNLQHRQWVRQRVRQLIPELRGKRVALLGLTYKPGTDTLRRSTAIEVARWLAAEGAGITAWDPALRALPTELASFIALQQSAQGALSGAVAALVMTECPEFREISAGDLLTWMATPLVLDAGRYLEQNLARDERVMYRSVGRSV